MPPLVSCLCVTEGRAAFMPWLLWGFERQTYLQKELVVIDSSPVPWSCNRANVRVISAPQGSNVPVKRNLALEHARGSYVAWFDDDDWQHPERLEILVEALRDPHVIVGSSRSWFVDLISLGARPYDGRGSLIFNTALFRTDIARAARFDEHCHRASDTPWLRELRNRHQGQQLHLDCESLAMWLCHDQNISNPRKKRRFPTPIAELVERVGTSVWGDTSEQLGALRRSLPQPLPELPLLRTGLLNPAESRARPSRFTGRNLTSIAQGAYEPPAPWSPGEVEVATTPTQRKPVRGAAEMPSVLGDTQLVVLSSRCEPPALSPWLEHWRSSLPGPFVAETPLCARSPDEECRLLREAISACATQFVLLLRPRIILAGSGAPWLLEGQRRLTSNVNIALVTAHPGAPVGPLGGPRSMASNGRLAWNGGLAAFRWHSTPQAYFLTRTTWLLEVLEIHRAVGLDACLTQALAEQQRLAIALPTPGHHCLELEQEPEPPLSPTQRHWLSRFEAGQLPKSLCGSAFMESMPCLPLATQKRHTSDKAVGPIMTV